MSALFNRPREGVTIPRIWIAVGLSLLIHAAALYRALPKMHRPMQEEEQGLTKGSLAVRLAPPPAPHAAPSPPPEPPPSPPPKVRPPRAVSQRAQVPPVIALNKPAPNAAPPVVAPPVEKTPPRPPADDLSALIEQRRRAREASNPSPPSTPSPGMVAAAPVEDDNARARRIAAANLAPKQQIFGYDPAAGGGVFQIRRVSLYDGEFVFYGWNRDIKRKTMQIIEVSKGNNADMRIAMVRKMIAIIRDFETDDFVWESKRLGRDMTLSARTRDNAYLEDFMLREFFPDAVVAR